MIKHENDMRLLLEIMVLISCDNCAAISYFVRITDLPPTEIKPYPFTLENIEIAGDTITLNATYSGGCNEHDFSLYMSPAAFFESYPVQANLYLRHNGYDDACDALISKEVSFNLRLIAELYKIFYGQYDEIIINVYDYFEGEPGRELRESYFPHI